MKEPHFCMSDASPGSCMQDCRRRPTAPAMCGTPPHSDTGDLIGAIKAAAALQNRGQRANRRSATLGAIKSSRQDFFLRNVIDQRSFDLSS